MSDLVPLFGDWTKALAVSGYKLLVSSGVFLCFWCGAFMARRLIEKLGRRTDPARRDMLTLIGQTTKISLLIFGLITALGTLGINVSALVAGLGLTGFALGFALRDA